MTRFKRRVMSGTEWTEPGQGATCCRLYEQVSFDFPYSFQTDRIAAFHRLSAIGNASGKHVITHTNIRLTGTHLTAEDLTRIAEAK